MEEAESAEGQSGPEASLEYSSIADLAGLDDETVGAAVEQSPFMMMSMVYGEKWSYDIYYVNQESENHVTETDDFSLKYQMEFHASRDMEAGEVEIRIPAALFKDRDGNYVLPTDVAVPRVNRPEEFVEVKNSPFNYYIEEDENGVPYLVFFNYCAIKSGLNAAWQVLYKNLDAMQIVDGTGWSLQAEAKVKKPPVSGEGGDGSGSEGGSGGEGGSGLLFYLRLRDADGLRLRCVGGYDHGPGNCR